MQKVCVTILTFFYISFAFADENLLVYVRGAEPLPLNAWEFYQIVTQRSDKGRGTYKAFDLKTEVEYGITDRFSVIGALQLQSVTNLGLLVDGYLPKDTEYGPKPSGMEAAMKYNFLSPAKDDLGLAGFIALDYAWLDPHSGQKKDTYAADFGFMFQKYLLNASSCNTFQQFSKEVVSIEGVEEFGRSGAVASSCYVERLEASIAEIPSRGFQFSEEVGHLL